MNRKERRNYMKVLHRKGGMTKEQAKATANQYIANAFKEGDLARINFNLCCASPQFKLQKEEFRQWIVDHKDSVLTIDKVRDNGMEVTFVEDEQEEKYWHKAITLIPVPSATIKLEDGTEKKIPLENISDVNDPKINEQINKALEG